MRHAIAGIHGTGQTELPEGIDLKSRGIDEAEAANIRMQLASFAEEWNSPEMDEYDDYDVSATRHMQKETRS